MTIINVVLKSDAVHLYTDGAGFAPDGVIAQWQNKAVTLPNWHAVVATRGAAFTVGLAAMAIIRSGLESFAAAARNFNFVMDKGLREVERENERLAKMIGDIDVVFCGWNFERDAPEAYVWANHKMHGWEKEKVIGPVRGLISPVDERLQRDLTKLGLDIESPDFDIDRDGVALMEAQRAIEFQPLGWTRRGSCAGGIIQRTSIYRDRIETRVLHRWPEDKIGERIDAGPVRKAA